MVNTKQNVETIEMFPRLHALTLGDDGSPAQDKTVSFNAIVICKLFFLAKKEKRELFHAY